MEWEYQRVVVSEADLTVLLPADREGEEAVILPLLKLYARQFVLAHIMPGGSYQMILAQEEKEHIISQYCLGLNPTLLTYDQFVEVARYIIGARWSDESLEIHFARLVFSCLRLILPNPWPCLFPPSPPGVARLQVDHVPGCPNYRAAVHGSDPAKVLTDRVIVMHWQRSERFDPEHPHKWFLVPVAIVYVNPIEGATMNQLLDEAWVCTEHDAGMAGGYWPSNKGVICLTDKPRSNMVGDVYYHQSTGKYYMVAFSGFTEVSFPFPWYITSPRPDMALLPLLKGKEGQQEA